MKTDDCDLHLYHLKGVLLLGTCQGHHPKQVQGKG